MCSYVLMLINTILYQDYVYYHEVVNKIATKKKKRLVLKQSIFTFVYLANCKIPFANFFGLYYCVLSQPSVCISLHNRNQRHSTDCRRRLYL